MNGDFLAVVLPEALKAFHFIRPIVLILLPIIAAFWWYIRSGAQHREGPAQGLAPHLQQALTVGESGARKLLPIDGVALGLALTVFAASGPTWSRMPDPFVSPTAPVVIVLKTTPSMNETDVAPSRLERAKFKIRDLLEMRSGARTALVAYAGSAHRVVPFTEDARIMVPYLEGLTPDIMPQEGGDARAALALALEMLAGEDAPGGVLFLVDDLDPADSGEMSQTGQNAVVFHAILPEESRSRGLDALKGPLLIPLTPDSNDLRQIDRSLNAAYRAALLETSSQPWQDRGWMFAVPAALLCLIWFRRGWTMKWALVLLLSATGLTAPRQANAEGIADWFFTRDQQGQRAFNQRAFAKAGTLFQDPMWQGYALFRVGQYDKAVEVLDRLETPEAAFVQGIAHLRNRQYREGVRAFETVLTRDPQLPGATENLATAQEILAFMEELRAQSDTGEESGIGADDTVFDNEAARGADTEVQAPQGDGLGLLTTEQWMNTVDTRTGDFLKQRFRLEVSTAGQ
ncbi:MAG: VWA domain-containing protein [Roseobacter sp.]